MSFRPSADPSAYLALVREYVLSFRDSTSVFEDALDGRNWAREHSDLRRSVRWHLQIDDTAFIESQFFMANHGVHV